MMSATPIPRSLALTAFGDSEVSTIRSLPPGRRPVRTHLTRMGNEARVYAIVRDELEAGRQAYLVYPAIEEGGARGLRAATAMAGRLRREFAPYSVGLVHSQLDEVTRADTMDRFAAGEISALVATSVVEVGVDVPNATVMVVEHAEVFGLAALHQLRGRVGRGGAQSYCHLVYQEPLTDDGRERLRVMYESNDGFFIAEEDLRIRGPGELQGSRQSGFLEFRFADLRRDMDTMIAARAQVAKLLKEDPELAHEDHAPLRRALEAAHAD
jgi:ATP-dependent DNA helicase RecG